MSGFLKLFGIGGSKIKEESSTSPSNSSNHPRPSTQIIRNNNSNSNYQRGGQPDEFADPQGSHHPNRRKTSVGRASQYQHYPESYPDPMKTTPLTSRPRSTHANGMAGLPSRTAAMPREVLRPKWSFHCQLAHGSPTGIISEFENVKQLYEKIAQCYDIDPSTIMFCTLNTHKVDMSKLLGGQISYEDFIFAHVKGQRKEIELVKEEQSLGLTITDNGAGYPFIRAIREGSQLAKVQGIEVGDHVERINEESFVGRRHIDVANRLRAIAVGETFVLRLITPEKSPFAMVQQRSKGGRPGAGAGGFASGKMTVRLKAGQQAIEQEMPTDEEESAIAGIDQLIEQFLGIRDRELAQSLLELGRAVSNPADFTSAVQREMSTFEFPVEFILDCWGAIVDAQKGHAQNGLAAAGGNANTN